MTNSLCFVLALCVGQVPAGSASPYAPAKMPASYVQSVTVTDTYVPAVPEKKTPVRNWFQTAAAQKAKPGCSSCGIKPGQAAAAPYGPIGSSPYAPIATGRPAPIYYPVVPSKSVPVTVADSTHPINTVPVYEESSLPPGVQGQPQIIHTPTGQIYEVDQHVVPGETVIIEGHHSVPTQVPAAPGQNLDVAKKYEKQVGHEHDYSWITGHLFYVHANGGCWVVRYGLPGEVDKFGGSVILAPGVEMKNYREGDLVCVYGEVLNENRTSTLGGALYRVNSILMIERAD